MKNKSKRKFRFGSQLQFVIALAACWIAPIATQASAVKEISDPKLNSLIQQVNQKVAALNSGALSTVPCAQSGPQTRDLVPTRVKRIIAYVDKNPNTNDITVILDKPSAVIYVLNRGRIVGVSRFLYGAVRNDDFPGGSIEAAYVSRLPLDQKKVTPAGRFMLVKGGDPDFGSRLVFDIYKSYILAIHRVYRGTPSEHRPERLASAKTSDKNISYGCVNVSDEFYDRILSNLPLTSRSHVYIIPNHVEQFDRFFPMLGQR